MSEGVSENDMKALRECLQRLVYCDQKTFSKNCRRSGYAPLLEGWRQELADNLSSVERELYRKTGRKIHLY